MTKRRAITGEEVDAYSDWRKYMTSLQRPGAVKKIKKRTHRRERREAARDIAEQAET